MQTYPGPNLGVVVSSVYNVMHREGCICISMVFSLNSFWVVYAFISCFKLYIWVTFFNLLPISTISALTILSITVFLLMCAYFSTNSQPLLENLAFFVGFWCILCIYLGWQAYSVHIAKQLNYIASTVPARNVLGLSSIHRPGEIIPRIRRQLYVEFACFVRVSGVYFTIAAPHIALVAI